MPAARHRAAGSGRSLVVRRTRARHARPPRARPAAGVATAAAVATMLGAGAGIAAGLAARPAPRALGTPLPRIQIEMPAPVPASQAGQPRALRQAAKARTPIDLGPLGAAQLSRFCGRPALVSRAGIWSCTRGGTPLDLDAACVYWHGHGARAVRTDGWRCHRPPS